MVFFLTAASSKKPCHPEAKRGVEAAINKGHIDSDAGGILYQLIDFNKNPIVKITLSIPYFSFSSAISRPAFAGRQATNYELLTHDFPTKCLSF